MSAVTYTSAEGVYLRGDESLAVVIFDNTEAENLFKYSEQFDNAAWTKTRSSISADATTAPDGTSTADKLVEDGTASNSHILQAANERVRSGVAYTYRFRLKGAERTFARLRFDNASTSAAWGGGGTPYATFDLTTGAVSNTYGTVTASVEDLGDDWYLCSVTATPSVTDTINPQLIMMTNATTVNYDGDGTSGLYVWGAQFSAGDLDYIVTTASEVTGYNIDQSEAGDDLTLIGNLTKEVVNTGAGLYALTSFSTSDYLTNSLTTFDAPAAVTWAAWIKLNSLTGTQAIVGNLRTSVSASLGGTSLTVEDGQLRLNAGNDAGTVTYAEDAALLVVDTWYFVVGVVSAAGALSLYKNGSLVATQTGASQWGTSALVRIGAQILDASTVSGVLDGSLTLVKGWDSALTAAQILDIYNKEKGLFLAQAPFRRVGEEYGLDVVLESYDESMTLDSSAVVSLGGNQETVERSRFARHDFTIGSIQRVPVSSETIAQQVIKTFLNSIQGGETFSLDVYGSVASANAPVNVIADPGFRFGRVNSSDLFTLPISAREV